MRDSVLMGARGAQPMPRPVRLCPVEAGQLQVDDPLGGRHIPVEPGYYQPGRVAMLDRQRLTVEADRQERVAAIGERLHWRAGGEPVDRRREHHIGVRVHTGGRQQISHPVACPDARRNQVAPNGIRHARQRRHHFDDVKAGELLEAVGGFAVHHAVDAQPPVAVAELGNTERGVHPVEVGAGGDKAR